MKISIIFLVGVAVGLAQTVEEDGSVEILEKAKARGEFEKYLLWGHALASSKHNLILGAKQPGDWILNQKVITESRSWIPFWRKTTSYSYSVPQPGYITYVEVIDQSTNGKGGYATLLSGGPGYRNVSISFESQRNEPLNFIATVYGKPSR